MQLNNLSNNNLLICFENYVRRERKITAQVLECISEIDRRKLYIEKGFTSLFDYLVKEFGYSPGAAMRRIDAARLLQEIPEVAEKFEAGVLTLTQANQLQRASREFKKMTKSSVQTSHKRDLVLKIESSSQKQTEQIIAESFNLPAVPVQKENVHRDQSVTLTITFTPEQIKVLEQAQNKISHAVLNKNWAETITHLAKREVARRTTVRKEAFPTKVKNSVSTFAKELNDKTLHTRINSSTAAMTLKSASKPSLMRPPIPVTLRKVLLHENAACEYRHLNGRRCDNKRFLQIDHIQSWSRGGDHSPANLQVLCGVHNRLKYELERISAT